MQNKVLERDNHRHGLNQSAPIGTPLDETIAALEARIKKLGDICQELNPYAPVSEEFKKRLREFHILEFDDPFKITNALLMLLEDSIDELHQLRPLSPEELHKENCR